MTVTITGTNFTGATAVNFGGVPAGWFTVVSPTSISALVGPGASGSVSVTTPAGTSSLAGFTFIPPPVISSFSPVSGPIGTTVTITGAHFSPTPADNIVYFGAVRALVSGATTTTLTVQAPAGTAHDPITVTTNNLTGYSNKAFTVTFPGGSSAFLPSSFAPKVTVGAGNEPYAICTSDWDGDGKPDLAIPLRYVGAASILRNTSTAGNVSFAPAVNFTTGANAYSADAGDIDGDGKPDLVVVNSLAYGFSVLRNTSTPGNISFAAKADFGTGGGQSWSATIGDVDGDGRPDLVVAFYSPRIVAVFRNTSTPGNISFDPEVDLVTQSFSQKAAIGDLDGDGKADIAVSSGPVVSVFKNTSTPGVLSFAPRLDLPSVNYPTQVTIGDLDGDGKNDLAAGIFGNIAVYRNTSSGGGLSFSPEVDLPSGNSPGTINMTDLNGDGKPDLSTVTTSDYTVAVLKNTSTPGTLSFDHVISYATGINGYSMLAADLDGDGKPDIASTTANNIYSSITVFVNKVGIPSITSFYPVSGKRGDTVHISGANLSGADTISFGGMKAASYVIHSDTSVTAVLGQGATGNVYVHTPLGTTAKGGFTFTGPTITSCTPDSAGPGATITITGTNLGSATAVSFGNMAAASFTIVSATQLTAVIGTGNSGDVAVITPVDTARLPGFAYFPPPTLTAITPSSADSGTVVQVTGTHFTSMKAVSFGGTPVTSFTVVSDNTLSVVVGQGTSGNVQITTVGGTTALPGFVFTGTTLTSITPLVGGPGTVITLHGTNFSGATSVTFGGTSASSLTVVSDTIITAVVGAGTSGAITVITPQGKAVLQGFTFNSTLPVITSFAPTSGPAGTTVTISGGNFDPLPANNFVYFGNVRAAVTSATANRLTVTVPVGASYHPITVTSKNFTAYTGPFTPTFPNGGNVDANAFSPITNLFIGHYPWSIVSGDFDGDGKADVAATVSSGSVSVLQNTSTSDTITFATPVSYGTGAAPFFVTAADFNGDGKTDLATANQNSNTISILQNTSSPGAISFAPKVDFGTGALPVYVATGDLDGDGLTDMVAGNSNSSVVSVLKNTSSGGSISFAPKVDIAAENAPTSIVLGDLDGDGRPDMVVASPVFNRICLYKNTSKIGAIFFGPKVDYDAGPNPKDLYITDLDGDGKPELIVADASGSNVSIFRNISTIGTIVFAPIAAANSGAGPVNISIADINGDGKPDITLAARNSNSASVLQNISTVGNIAFATHVDFTVGSLGPPTGGQPTGITTGDFDGDGRPDMILANSGGSQETTISVLRNKMNNPLQPRIDSITPSTAARGATVLIKGRHLTGATAVSLGGIPADGYTILSDTTITAVVGNGATGVVAVTTPYGTASLGGFVYIYPHAIISAFIPTSGATGDTILVRGDNFTTTQSVRLGGISAGAFKVLSDTVLYAVVGTGATGAVSVTTQAGTDSLAGFTFIIPPPTDTLPAPPTDTLSPPVTPPPSDTLTPPPPPSDTLAPPPSDTLAPPSMVPVVKSFAPASAGKDSTVTILGTHLDSVYSVSLGGTPAQSFSIVSDSMLVVVVGSGSSGAVVVTSSQGADTLGGFTFITPPTDTLPTPPDTLSPPVTPPPSDTLTPPPPSPVFQLVDFTGGPLNNQPVLHWQVSNEKSISYYVIEHGGDTTHFVSVSSIKARGMDTASYVFTDPAPRDGINFYRLKIEDTAGRSTYSPIVGVQLSGLTPTLLIYPNPANGSIRVTLPGSTIPSQFELVDMSGHVVQTVAVSPGVLQATIEVTKFNRGVYKIIWTDGQNYSYQTILIMR